MKKNRKILVLINFFALFSIYLFAAEKTEDISAKTAVIFNTLCAKCHEGQCSGRLSFDTGSDAASNHIKRYSDSSNISKGEIKEFFSLLNYMKKECLLLMPDDGKWEIGSLSRFALPSHKGYFIPLGVLKSGDYYLVIKTKESVRFRIEVISNSFDAYLDQTVCSNTKERLFNFTLDESLNSFLRIRSKEALHITALEIKKACDK
ncbi:MAG: hypothetical protein U9O83_02710 [Campylobacterota bacterium]|nr:hypothetical protein [Campylobacterota bacterium]